jgi:hypothetical protein
MAVTKAIVPLQRVHLGAEGVRSDSRGVMDLSQLQAGARRLSVPASGWSLSVIGHRVCQKTCGSGITSERRPITP